MRYLVIRVIDNQIVNRFGDHDGNTPGEAIANATVNNGILQNDPNSPNRAWLIRNICLVQQKQFISIKYEQEDRYNLGAISSDARSWYVNCRQYYRRTNPRKEETDLYKRMLNTPNFIRHAQLREVMGYGGGVGYAGYAEFNTFDDAKAYLENMAFVVTK